MNANHAKKKKSHTLYIHPRAPTHIYICVCTYIYVCIWKQKMHTACNVGFLCVWGGWFSVKCRALYKLLGFFSNKVEMHCCLCLFESTQGAVVLEKALLLFPSIFWVTKKGLGGLDGSLFIFWGLPELLGWVWSVRPHVPKLPAAVSVEFFFTHLGRFESWWAA